MLYQESFPANIKLFKFNKKALEKGMKYGQS